MKNILVSLLVYGGLALATQGASVTFTNYDEALNRHRPISTSSGTGILAGGIVVVGGWASDPSPLISQIAATQNPALLSELLTQFISFGAATSIGADFSGLYESDAQRFIRSDDPLVGKTIYTVIGNGSSVLASTDIALLTDGAVFAADNPFYAVRADISSPETQLLLGMTFNGPVVRTALGSTPSLQLGILLEPLPSGVIPEPYSTSLILAGLLLAASRRTFPRTHD